MSAHWHQSMSGKDLLSTFRGDFQIWIGTTLILIVSMIVLINPARAYDLSAEVKLYNNIHNQVGTAKLTQQGEGDVAVQVRVHDLPAGFHGFHVHTIGQCVPGTPAIPDAPGVPGIPGTTDFSSAGGHFDLGRAPPPTPHSHKDHSGDFPVLLVNTDGTANAKFNTDRFSLADLFDADGSAIIIHANPDNYTNIPDILHPGNSPYVGYIPTSPQVLNTTLMTGDAGGRIACGVVEKVVKREREREDERENER